MFPHALQTRQELALVEIVARASCQGASIVFTTFWFVKVIWSWCYFLCVRNADAAGRSNHQKPSHHTCRQARCVGWKLMFKYLIIKSVSMTKVNIAKWHRYNDRITLDWQFDTVPTALWSPYYLLSTELNSMAVASLELAYLSILSIFQLTHTRSRMC